jgi:urease subunit gamma/beta
VDLGPTELDRLLVFQVAEFARRQRERGLKVSAPEAIAIACDEMHVAARAGLPYEEVRRAGLAAVSADDLMDGVSAMIAEIRVEVIMGDGTRLIVLRGLGSDGASDEPGAVEVAAGEITINEGLESLELEVENTSDHVIRISSHYPFDRTNPRLTFDRAAGRDTRLDIPAGDTVRWAPGERRVVRLVRVRGGEGEA